MTVPVITAVGEPQREADLVAQLASGAHPVEIVRRCVDVADLLATASAGLARAVVLSAELRRLDRDALTRLAVAGVAVVGLVAPGDEDARRRLISLGVREVVTSDAGADAICSAVLAAVGAGAGAAGHAFADPRISLPSPAVALDERDGPDERPADGARTGTVLAVWGPAGAPGRTSVAIGLAAELALMRRSVLLVDADPYGGVIAQLLGLLDEAPGLAAACRLANNGTLDSRGLVELCVEVRPHLQVLTGIARAERWPELRPAALDAVLMLARASADFVIVDCGFSLERDEELSFDTTAPRRNGATLSALSAADTVLAIAAADPVGLQRIVRNMGDLADAVPGVSPMTIVNRVRPAVVGPGDPEAQIAAALERYAGLHDVRFIPLDVPAFDAAVAAGRTLPEIAAGSPARQALQAIAASLAGSGPPAGKRRRFFSLSRPG